jgi:hypothetical protein
MRRHISYANVTATLALFFALAGGTYAATQLPKNSVGSTQVKANALSGSDIKNNSIKGADVLESSLTQVPSAKKADSATSATTAGSAARATTADSATTAATAANANRLGGLDANTYKLRCPSGTRAKWGACLELDAHDPATPLTALDDCSNRGGRLPTWLELDWIRHQDDITWAQGAGFNQYELTGEALNPAAANRSVIAIDRTGQEYGGAMDDATALRYRCVLTRVNG